MHQIIGRRGTIHSSTSHRGDRTLMVTRSPPAPIVLAVGRPFKTDQSQLTISPNPIYDDECSHHENSSTSVVPLSFSWTSSLLCVFCPISFSRGKRLLTCAARYFYSVGYPIISQFYDVETVFGRLLQHDGSIASGVVCTQSPDVDLQHLQLWSSPKLPRSH